MEIKKGVQLSKYNTFGIGGLAEYFCVAKNKNELVEALNYAINNNLNFYILGGGSNVLIPDEGLSGLVIKNSSNSINYRQNSVTVDSGVSLAFLVNDSINNGFGGLEFASGIPGTVGGAVVGNAGAYEESISDFLISATIYNNGKLETWTNGDFAFKYRDSKLKKYNNLVVIDVQLGLNNIPNKEALDRIIEDHKRRVKSYLGRNVGSYFKNISTNTISGEILENLKPYTMGDKVIAAKLIESLNLKGYKVGGVGVSEAHANVINNINLGTAEDVLTLEKEIIEKVYNEYKVTLQPEVVKL